MVIHNDPCGGRIVFETRQQALVRWNVGVPEAGITPMGVPPPALPTEIRQLYCERCHRYWPKKREMWAEAHPEEDA